jgi:hypothetical protein
MGGCFSTSTDGISIASVEPMKKNPLTSSIPQTPIILVDEYYTAYRSPKYKKT